MRNMILILMTTLALGASLQGAEAQAETPDIEKDITRLLKGAGAVSYARKQPYGAGIERMVLGYGEAGKPVVGLAVRNTKTYAQAQAIVAVTPDKNGYKVVAAEIPEVGAFHGKSQTLTKDALKDITGKVFKDRDEARSLVDAVTGATQYYKAIYVSYALMASKVIEELSDVPDWPRTPIER